MRLADPANKSKNTPMPSSKSYLSPDDAIAAEQIKAFFQETNAQNLAGIVVLGLISWVAADQVPGWTWLPGLALALLATLVRAWLIRAYHRQPSARSSAVWGDGQAWGAIVNGSAWGLANTSMTAFLPLGYQLFIATVAAVSASAAASEGFAYFRPSRNFIVTSLSPLALWYLLAGDEIHVIIGVMLLIYIPLLLWQGQRRHAGFVETLKLRFHNEFLARELDQQRRIAEDASVAKARFLAAASHDLRQPMQALGLFLELMRGEMTLTERGRDFYSKAQQAMQGVSSLLSALLDVSRLDSNNVTPQPRPVRVGDLLLELHREFFPTAERKGLELRTVPTRACIETDPVLLGQILRNLISNAIRYTQRGGLVVGCRRRNGQLAIEVWDSGIGIGADQQQRIFDEFYQVGNPERDRQQGLGLGLAIVERAARLLGAQVDVRSQLGRGSCFSVLQPLSQAPLGNPPRPLAQSGSPYDLNGRRVLVIENEDLIREGVHQLLENWGCEVVSGRSAACVEALLERLSAPPEVVLSDFGLPGEANGIAVIEQLRARYGNGLAALLMTGDTSQGALEAAQQANLDLLHKPVRPWRLRHSLCALLNPAVRARSA